MWTQSPELDLKSEIMWQLKIELELKLLSEAEPK